MKTFPDGKLNPWSSVYHPGHPHCFYLWYVSSSAALAKGNEDDSKRKKLVINILVSWHLNSIKETARWNCEETDTKWKTNLEHTDDK